MVISQFYVLRFSNDAIENSKNAAMLTITTLAPEGSSKAYDAAMPSTKHTTEMTAENTTTALKLRHRRMLVSAGKMMRLDIRSAPIMRMPRTTVTAVSTAITVF